MGEPMRALTVRQPYAHMIARCGKTTENRPKPVRYRGLIAVHAGAYSRWDQAGADDPQCRRAWYEWAAALPHPNVTGPLRREAIHLDFGAVIAVAVVAGCHDATYAEACSCSPWARPRSWHWELADVRPLTRPVPCRGMLGLWRLPDDVEKSVREQMGAQSKTSTEEEP